MDAHRQDPGTGYDENSSVCPLVKAPSVLEGGSEKNDVVVEAPLCAFSGCTSKAMPLTMYCYQHILFDSRQTLYKPCSFKTSSAQTCGKPTLRAASPSFCTVHARHLLEAVRAAVLELRSSSNCAPRFHLVIADSIRQIQNNKRMALSSSNTTDSDE